MRNVILVLIFLIFTFSINVAFYYVSPNYREFLRKHFNESETVIELENAKNEDIKNLEDKIEEKIDEDLSIIKPSEKNDEIFKNGNDNKVEIKPEITLGKHYREVLELFKSYDLKELEINTSLFDITTEYPDNYIEYYSKGLTLYFFPTKTYNEIYDIFSVLEYELPFTLNPVNNFGDNSFYINLNEDINDNVIRLIISNKGIVFGLKIKKNEYNLVKEKLNILKINQ